MEKTRFTFTCGKIMKLNKRKELLIKYQDWLKEHPNVIDSQLNLLNWLDIEENCLIDNEPDEPDNINKIFTGKDNIDFLRGMLGI
jgi:hypothetical protein